MNAAKKANGRPAGRPLLGGKVQSLDRDAIEQRLLFGGERLRGMRRRPLLSIGPDRAGPLGRLVGRLTDIARADARIKRLRKDRGSDDGGENRRSDNLAHSTSP